MSKIEEMAERYATEGDEFSGLHVIEVEKDTYIAGANAVLKEIENILAEFSNTEDYSVLQRKIKELKGE